MSEPNRSHEFENTHENRKRRVQRSVSEVTHTITRRRVELSDQNGSHSGRCKLKEPLTTRDLEYPGQSSGPEEEDDKEGHYKYRQNGDNLTGRFKILGPLGQGTFGRVLKCFDRKTHKHVAIKVMRSLKKYNVAAMNEMDIIWTLQNNEEWDRRTVNLIDWFVNKGHICLVLPLLGPTLCDVVRQNTKKAFPVDMVRRYMKQIFEGLAYMHGNGIVHTDVKLENLVFDDVPYRSRKEYRKQGLATVFPTSDKLTIIDFGSAVFVEKRHPKLISTRHYRAPEIILQIGWDIPCDLWSAGCIFVELLTGCLLFRVHEDLEHLAMIERLIGPLPVHVAHKHGLMSESGLVDSTTLKVKWPQGSEAVCGVQMMPKLDNLFVRQTNPSISAELKEMITDLLSKIFCWDPNERITANDALEHPFFAETDAH